jgi:shikimate kinase
VVTPPPALQEGARRVFWTGQKETGMGSETAVAPVQIEPERQARLLDRLGTRSIVLVGMMGAGKSSVGRRLATALDLPFRDADTEIEAAHKMPIPEIFSTYGEPYFRAGEVRVIARLLDNGPQVLATGGGAFMNEQTRERIAAQGLSIWLKAEFDVLMRRVRRRADRPLLKTADPEATLRGLIEARYPTYALADLTIVSREVPHETIVVEVIDRLCRHLCLNDPVPETP